MRTRALILATCLLAPGVLLAEEAGEKVERPLDKALKELGRRKEFVAQVEVSREGGGGMGAAAMVMGGMTGAKEPFEGEVEAWRTGDTLLLVSKDVIPGFAIHIDDERVVTRRSYEEDDAASLDHLHNELASILDPKALAKRLKKAKLEEEAGVEGETVYTGEVSKKLVKNASAGVMGLTPQVLRVETEVTVKKDRIVEAVLSVVHTDPMTELMQRQGGMGMAGAGNEPTEGDTTVYTIRFPEKKEPSERAQKAKKELRKLVDVLEAQE